jgi:hypothetical protein
MRTLDTSIGFERLLRCMAYPNFILQVPAYAALFYVFSALAAGLPANEETLLNRSTCPRCGRSTGRVPKAPGGRQRSPSLDLKQGNR